MQRREKVLAGIVGALLVLLVLYWVGQKVGDAYSERRGRIAALEGEIHKKKQMEHRGMIAQAQLAAWEARSLPADRELARTLYLNWLFGVADRVKFTGVNIDGGRGGMHKNTYYKLPFSVRGRGTLEQATQFLHEFYRTDHLHQLRSVTVKPLDNSKELELSFIIEALVLPTADRTDRLNDSPSSRLARASLKEYTDTIVQRNLFAEWSPPPPPRPVGPPPTAPMPPPRPSFDPARYAVLTAILQVGQFPEVWVNVKTTGELMKLSEGDTISVGQFRGKITWIGAKEIEIESDGRRQILAVGKSLRETTDRPTGE
jgi:hypothetical protein